MPTIYTPLMVLQVALAFLFLGLTLGWFVCSLVVAASKSDDEMDFEELLLFAKKPVLWRYRVGQSVAWIYTDEASETNLVPAHWQKQAFALVVDPVDLVQSYTGIPSTSKERA